jgi:hypothetical protein
VVELLRLVETAVLVRHLALQGLASQGLEAVAVVRVLVAGLREQAAREVVVMVKPTLELPHKTELRILGAVVVVLEHLVLHSHHKPLALAALA